MKWDETVHEWWLGKNLGCGGKYPRQQWLAANTVRVYMEGKENWEGFIMGWTTLVEESWKMMVQIITAMH